MVRKRQTRRPTNADAIRRVMKRMEQAIDAAPPHKAASLVPRLAPLMERLTKLEAPDDAARNFHEAVAQQQQFDEEIEHCIESRTRERLEALLGPDEWELERRARAVAGMLGGTWQEHLPNVRLEQEEFMQSLLARTPDRTWLDRWTREQAEQDRERGA